MHLKKILLIKYGNLYRTFKIFIRQKWKQNTLKVYIDNKLTKIKESYKNYFKRP